MIYHLIPLPGNDKFPVQYKIAKDDETFYIVLGNHSELVCDCPQARYRDPRCKHVLMVEEALELKTYGIKAETYNSETERMESSDGN